MKLISVIVPVYNTEKYIEKCVMSILNRKYATVLPKKTTELR